MGTVQASDDKGSIEIVKNGSNTVEVNSQKPRSSVTVGVPHTSVVEKIDQGPAGPTGAAGSYIVSVTAPVSPSVSDVWFNSDNGRTYIYYNDGNTSQWVEFGNANSGPTGATGSATTDASLLTSGTLNTNRLPATGIFTTAIQAKETGDTYPAAQIASTGKIWSQPSKFPPYNGTHNTQYVGYGTDTQVYIERSELTSSLVTLKMNRFQAISSEQAQVTSTSPTGFPLSAGGTMTLADASGFPNTAGSGTISYQAYSNSLTTGSSLPAGWTNRTPYGGTLSRFAVDANGAYCTTNDGPSIATVETGELAQEVTCRFSGTLQNSGGIVLRYNEIGGGAASYISVRYESTYKLLTVYGYYRNTSGVVTGDYITQTKTFGFVSGMYVKAIVDGDLLAIYTGTLNTSTNEVEYSTPVTAKIGPNDMIGTIGNKLLSGKNAGLVLHGTTASTLDRYTDFSVRAKKSFTYTGKSGSILTGVTCATEKSFTADSTTFATYSDLSPINLVVAVDSIGAVIWRLKNMGGQHTTDNITMGATDVGLFDIGLVFQSDINRTGSGLVFYGDSAPTDTPNAAGGRGTFLRRVASRLIRSGGRLHIAPSNITNYAGTATGDGTTLAPHLGIGNVDTGLYLTTGGTPTNPMDAGTVTNICKGGTTISTTGTIGTVTGTQLYVATITGMSSTTGLEIGDIITATNGTGSFGGGTTIITNINSSNSITVSSTAVGFDTLNVAVDGVKVASLDAVGLNIAGSFSRGAPVTKTAHFTLADNENWVICNGTASITATLPSASTYVGREVTIKNIAAFTVISNSSNVVPIGSATAGNAILPATAGTSVTLVSDGTNWIVMRA